MRNWAIVLGALLLLVAAVYFWGPAIYVRYFLEQACEPSVRTFDRAERHGVTVSARLAQLFAEDQQDRRDLANLSEGDGLSTRDAARRHEVKGYLLDPGLHTAEDFYFAAMIFHHGTCAEHHGFAHELASESLALGHPSARWLYASTLDRYLRSSGKRQLYGTQ